MVWNVKVTFATSFDVHSIPTVTKYNGEDTGKPSTTERFYCFQNKKDAEDFIDACKEINDLYASF